MNAQVESIGSGLPATGLRTLRAGNVLPLGSSGGKLEVLHGRVWLTRSGDPERLHRRLRPVGRRSCLRARARRSARRHSSRRSSPGDRRRSSIASPPCCAPASSAAGTSSTLRTGSARARSPRRSRSRAVAVVFGPLSDARTARARRGSRSAQSRRRERSRRRRCRTCIQRSTSRCQRPTQRTRSRRSARSSSRRGRRCRPARALGPAAEVLRVWLVGRARNARSAPTGRSRASSIRCRRSTAGPKAAPTASAAPDRPAGRRPRDQVAALPRLVSGLRDGARRLRHPQAERHRRIRCPSCSSCPASASGRAACASATAAASSTARCAR